MSTVWGIHNDSIPAATLVDQGFVSIGWDTVGDLSSIGDDQMAIREVVAAAHPDAKPGAIPVWAGVLRRFAFEIAEGDLVAAPNKARRTVNIGVVTGPYYYQADTPAHRHRRPVKWLRLDVPRSAFTQSALYELGSAVTLFQVANHAEEFETIVAEGIPEVARSGASQSEQRPAHMRYSLLQRTMLEILRDQSPLSRRDVMDELPRRIDFTPAEQSHTSKGLPRYEAAATWNSVNMVAAGWIEKASGDWRITPAGLEILDSGADDLTSLSSAAYRQQQDAKRAERSRFTTPRYPLIDEAVKLLPEGRWITYSELASVVGSSASSVGDYVHGMDLEGHHRVVPSGEAPYTPELRESLAAEGVTFTSQGLPDLAFHFSPGELREEMELLDLLPKVARRAWLVRGFSPRWLSDDLVALPTSSVATLSPGSSRTELAADIGDDHSHLSYNARSEKLDDLHAFLTRMQPGHLVVSLDENTVHIGTIVDEAESQLTDDGATELVRHVDWVGSGIDRSRLPTVLLTRVKVRGTVVELTQQIESVESLLKAEADETTPTPAPKVVLTDASAELASELHVPQTWLQECIDLLNDRPQLIFYGPPGTGKTYLAQHLAKHVAGDNVRLVQFHPAYSYEDFFEGYRPRADGGFELKPGPLRKIVDQALAAKDEAFVLIIDEINRGNLAKVFGELYFLLEYRTENVELLYADEEFNLPENVFIIGTMNTADRSIALVDAAMRRRFAFLPLHPSEEPTSGILRSWLATQELPSRTADLLDELNSRIDDPDFKIGPSYFMRAAVHADEAGLERAWRTSVLPLLEEHHFGELDRAAVHARYGLNVVSSAAQRAAASTNESAEAPSDAQPDPH